MGNFNNINPGSISISDFNYPLPDEKIAKYPLPQRDQSKLLVWKNHSIEDRIFSELPDLLPTNSLLIFNNTKVIRARLLFEKETGARIEIFCLDPHEPSDYQIAFQQTKTCTWKCMIGNLKKWKEGTLKKSIIIEGENVELCAEKISSDRQDNIIRFIWNNVHFEFSKIIEHAGILPIPPYLNRETEESDLQRYQTVYSKIKGSVAAPTAGLHFTEEVFQRIREKGYQTEELTLHVGAGTFQPVKSETIEAHRMHAEQIYIPQQLIERLLKHRGPRIAVGTTTIRTLESIYWLGTQITTGSVSDISNLKISQWEPYQGTKKIEVNESLQAILSFMKSRQTDHFSASTEIIIVPGYEFTIIDGMLTNFHQPQSTLLLLVSAFLGENWKTVYNHALQNNYRFLSYGDSNLYLK
ncbi:MAG: S-adenosylmethionine tRNA ribosyltransferase [Bacteroidetes bacterium GWF2_42_66]|nr:MAG: S-adenosylmethionine tRNA ribosyltransferase [Bacteroidetes bacterium GWA2_42_15]OFY01159.1 MAG: S-adenosylmethionine tRNA ribosyltransferase [Bacteroidetes bacterium GWE2_42_39]OFY42002.1 MAG: S-adenosylmethionine tRNA ribosyltransferase [Bacteroidetes bacterium GWF2_42_66]HBL77799.1 S-adenosylmethionine tRNA ribosyltransferase [Prolixibacteraceae bacterium]HCR90462.1 S-adenosylmethionine tRNA ribosyltransferase [Prolixibacteraceae bacterium]